MRLVLDRIEKKQDESRIFIFECDEMLYDINENNIPLEIIQSLKVGLILEADIINNTLCSPKILIEETNKKTDEINIRLNNLFKRKKQG